MSENDYKRRDTMPLVAMMSLPATKGECTKRYGPKMPDLSDMQAKLAAVSLPASIFRYFLGGRSIEELSDEECKALLPEMRKAQSKIRRTGHFI